MATGDRLAIARDALAKVTARTSTRPLHSEPVLSDEALLPVAPALHELLPYAGLRRGTTVAVPAAPQLTLALLAEASAKGSWCALVGMPEVGLVAAHEAGLDLARTALVPYPEADLVAVLSALLEGLEVVAFTGGARLPAGDRQRLAAKSRERGAVLVSTDAWPGADLELCTRGGRWHGPVGHGQGRLRARHVRVRVSGRGLAHRGREATVALPDESGRIACLQAADEAAPTRPSLYQAG
jgi:hypothetical protein